MILTVTLDSLQQKALTAATALHNQGFGTTLTPEEYFQLRATTYLDEMVKRYRESVKLRMEASFDAMTPEEQTQILQQLGITL